MSLLNFYYLFFNFLVIGGPLAVWFFYPKFRKLNISAAFISVLGVLIIFSIWDIWVTNIFWYFNPYYLLGIYLVKIPLEEVLFFLTVPFSCLFLYSNLKDLIPFDFKVSPKLVYALWFSLLLAACFFYFYKLYYSLSVCLAWVLIIWFDLKSKIFVINKANFWIFLGAVFILTLIFNYMLTSLPIVTYNPAYKTNFLVLTIPVEDFIYGIALIHLSVLFYEKLKKTI